MTILQSPLALMLFVASNILTLCGPRIKKYGVLLPFLGGFCTSAGIICSFLAGATMQEILIFVLIILLVSFYNRGVWEGRRK